MKKLTIPLIVAASFLISPLIEAATKLPETKIIVQSIAAEVYPDDAPCFIVYPDALSAEILQESGAAKLVAKSLEKLGYSIVEKESEAVVFVRIYFEKFEPYDTIIELKQRPSIDYSNASSTRNYAAIVQGGRYQQLANPTLARDRNDVGAVLGPSGEVIMLSEQDPVAAKVVEKDPEAMKTTVHPIVFEVSAWQFPKDAEDSEPQQIWATLATYNNLQDEETEAQLRDMCKATTRYFGKSINGEKLVKRK